MSLTDQAFIKAYHNEQPPRRSQPSAAAHAPAAKAEPAAQPKQQEPAAGEDRVEPAPAAAAPPQTEVAASPSSLELLTADETELLRSGEIELPAQPSEQPPPAEEELEENEPETIKFGPLANLTQSGELGEPLKPRNQIEALALPAVCQSLLSVAEEAFLGFARQIERQAADSVRLLAVATCTGQEGGTTFTLCLAKSLAKLGLKVAVVDGNFQSPGLTAQLNLQPQATWLDVLEGNSTLSEALIESTGDGLVVLPLARGTEEVRWDNEPRLRLSLGLLRRDFDLVLIDGGPLGKHNPRPTGWPQVDAALIVRNPHKSSPQQVEEAEQILHDAGVSCLGIAENFM